MELQRISMTVQSDDSLCIETERQSWCVQMHLLNSVISTQMAKKVV